MKRVLGSVVTGAGVLVCLGSWAERQLAPSLTEMGVGLGQVIAPPVGHALPNDDGVWKAFEQSLLPSEKTVERTHEKSVEEDVTAEPRKKLHPRAERAVVDAEPLPSLFVSAEQVLRLSRTARIPAGRHVPAVGRRPAGLQVAGVGGLGIGVQDGDVLTRVAGAPTPSASAVVSSVLQLRAKHVEAISAEVWRGERPYRITFEMPYLEPQTPPSVGSPAKEAAKHPVSPSGSSSGGVRKAAFVVGATAAPATAD